MILCRVIVHVSKYWMHKRFVGTLYAVLPSSFLRSARSWTVPKETCNRGHVSIAHHQHMRMFVTMYLKSMCTFIFLSSRKRPHQDCPVCVCVLVLAAYAPRGLQYGARCICFEITGAHHEGLASFLTLRHLDARLDLHPNTSNQHWARKVRRKPVHTYTQGCGDFLRRCQLCVRRPANCALRARIPPSLTECQSSQNCQNISTRNDSHG
jgi:hypothetical protein